MFLKTVHYLRRIIQFFKKTVPNKTLTGDVKLFLLVLLIMTIFYLMMVVLVGTNSSFTIERVEQMLEALESFRF